MHFNEIGVTDRSIHYFSSPSDLAREAYCHTLSVGHFFCENPYYLHRMRYDSYLAALVVDGCLTLRCPDRDIPVLPGGLMLVDCYKEHCYFAPDRCEFYFVHFAGPGCQELVEHIHGNNGQVLAPPLGKPFLPVLKMLLEMHAKSKRPSEVEIAKQLYSFLCELSRCHAQNLNLPKRESEMDSVIKYIHEHLAEALTLESLAQLINYSQGHFNRMFHMHTGISVYHYITLCRIDQAKHLLHTSTDSIHQIGQATGFPSDANFIRIFTKYTGYTPSGFRKVGL